MIYIVQNAAPILLAALAGLVIAAGWYRPVRPNASLIATVFLAEAWLAAILAGALILAPPKGGVWTMTLGSAFVIWIGFVMPAIVATYRIRGIVGRRTATDCGYWLVTMLAMAAVMRAVGLVAPAG